MTYGRKKVFPLDDASRKSVFLKQIKYNFLHKDEKISSDH